MKGRRVTACVTLHFFTMIKSNCHTHTVFCDGKNTAEEMICSAIDKGFVSLGFSGHSPMYFDNEWAMTTENEKTYFDEINQLKEKYKNQIQIYCGIELDSDCVNDDASEYDYVIGSVHQLHYDDEIYSIDATASELSECVNKRFDGDWVKMAEAYYASLYAFVSKISPDVVGHYDLIEKFNEDSAYFNTESSEYQAVALKYLDKICKELPDVIFEVNTGAMYRCGKNLPYPAPFIMKRLKENGMKITLTSDSHDIDSLDFAFEKTADYCRDFGFDYVYIFKDGSFKVINL